MLKARIRTVTVSFMCSVLCFIAAIVGLTYNEAANPSSDVRTIGYEIPPPEDLSPDESTLGHNGTYNLRGWSCGVYDFAYSIGYSADALQQTCTLAVSLTHHDAA